MNILKNRWFEYVYIPNSKVLIFFILLALATASVLGYYTPIIVSELYDSFGVDKNMMPIIWSLGGLYVGEYLASVVYQLGINRYIQKLLQHIRSKSYKKWILAYDSIGKGKFGSHNYPMGEVIARILNDTEAVIEMVSSGSFKIFIDFAFIISSLISFVRLNTVSGVALIIAEVLVCAALIIGSKQMGKVYMAVRKSTGHLNRSVANISAGLRHTFHTPNQNFASTKSKAAFDDFLKKQLTANIWDASYFAIAESLFPILLALLVIVFPYSNIVEMAIIAAIIAVATSAASYMQAKKAEKMAAKQAEEMAAVQLSGHNSNRSLYTVYGEALVGSTTVWKSISGRRVPLSLSNFVIKTRATGADLTSTQLKTAKRYFYRVVTLCNGPIEDITNILVDGEGFRSPRFGYDHNFHFLFY